MADLNPEILRLVDFLIDIENEKFRAEYSHNQSTYIKLGKGDAGQKRGQGMQASSALVSV